VGVRLGRDGERLAQELLAPFPERLELDALGRARRRLVSDLAHLLDLPVDLDKAAPGREGLCHLVAAVDEGREPLDAELAPVGDEVLQQRRADASSAVLRQHARSDEGAAREVRAVGYAA